MKIAAQKNRTAFEVKVGDTILLKDGEKAEITNEFERILIVRTETQQVKAITPEDVIELVRIGVQTVGFVKRIIAIIKGWFKK